MSVLLILGLVFAFYTGGFLAQRAARTRVPDAAVMMAGAASFTFFYFMMVALPFHGAWGEIPAVGCAALAFAAPMTLVLRNQTRGRDNILLFAGRAVFLFFGFGLVLLVLFLRLGYAYKLGWECDGRIVEVDRNGGRRALRVVVEGVGGRDEFDGVGSAFWTLAAPGKTLIKKSGSPKALLDGTPVRMLEPVGFWNDPP